MRGEGENVTTLTLHGAKQQDNQTEMNVSSQHAARRPHLLHAGRAVVHPRNPIRALILVFFGLLTTIPLLVAAHIIPHITPKCFLHTDEASSQQSYLGFCSANTSSSKPDIFRLYFYVQMLLFICC